MISVVIPLKNEEENIKPLIQEVEEAMNPLSAPWELICVDDGSTDNTLPILQKLTESKSNLKVLSFSQNYGQSSGFDAGFKAARGEFVVTLDGDRQNDPRDIPKLVEAVRDCDMVCGIRAKRKDTPIKKLTSRLANWIRSRVLDDGMKDTGCSLKIYRKSCLDKLKLYNGMHRFLPALFQIEGFKVKQVPVNHRERAAGTTKYSFLNRSFNTIYDLWAVRWMKKRHLNYTVRKEIP